MKSKFQVDANRLDKSAAEAFSEHVAGRMSYAEWTRHGAHIQRLRKIEGFRKEHGEALYNAAHPEHDTRTTELQSLYEGAYPDGGPGEVPT